MLDLVIVMPVYNEEECIVDVVSSWHQMLSQLGMSFQIIVLNDGSKDHTIEALQTFRDNAQIEIVDKPNAGHGPTILQGYRRAVEVAEWVFQCDSDDEMKAEFFPELWSRREGYDILLGYRVGRQQNIGRKLISVCSRLTVNLLFGLGVIDVNTPYRLMRVSLLKMILPQIPVDTFAPNVIIAGSFARAKARIYNHPIPHGNRKTGSVSIIKWKLVRAAFRSFRQTLRCRPTLTLTDTPSKESTHVDR